MLDTLTTLLRWQFALQIAAVVGVSLAGHFLVWQPLRRRQLASARQVLERDRQRIVAVLTAMADLVHALAKGVVVSQAARADLRGDFAALVRATEHPDTNEELVALARRFERRAQALARALAAGEGNATLVPMLQSLYAMHLEGSAMATRASMRISPSPQH